MEIPYEELPWRTCRTRSGSRNVANEKGEVDKKVVGKTCEEKEVLDSIKKEDWNEYVIVAKGNVLTHTCNGHVTVKVTDNDEKNVRDVRDPRAPAARGTADDCAVQRHSIEEVEVTT